jgi:hypothetical protein
MRGVGQSIGSLGCLHRQTAPSSATAGSRSRPKRCGAIGPSTDISGRRQPLLWRSPELAQRTLAISLRHSSLERDFCRRRPARKKGRKDCSLLPMSKTVSLCFAATSTSCVGPSALCLVVLPFGSGEQAAKRCSGVSVALGDHKTECLRGFRLITGSNPGAASELRPWLTRRGDQQAEKALREAAEPQNR